jgi:hypothetical protein
MRLSTGGAWSAGERHAADLLMLEPGQRELATWLMRRGEATVTDAIAERGGEPHALRGALDALVADGFAERVDGAADLQYRMRLASRPSRTVPADIWTSLGQAAPPSRPATRGPRAATLAAWRAVLSAGGQFVLAASPVILVALLAEILLLREAASFAALLGFTGVIANSMTAGVFPVLLLVASRRKGEYVPGTEYRWLGHPAFAMGIYVISVVNLLVHGLVIYREPWTRACALVFGALAIALTVRTVRGGAFARRSVVELRADARTGEATVLTVMSGGQPLPADVTVGRPEGEDTYRGATMKVPALSKLSHLTVRLPAGRARAVKVWTHQVTAEGTTETVPSIVDVSTGGETRRFDLKLSGGQTVTPTGGGECVVRIALRRGEDV